MKCGKCGSKTVTPTEFPILGGARWAKGHRCWVCGWHKVAPEEAPMVPRTKPRTNRVWLECTVRGCPSKRVPYMDNPGVVLCSYHRRRLKLYAKSSRRLPVPLFYDKETGEWVENPLANWSRRPSLCWNCEEDYSESKGLCKSCISQAKREGWYE